DTSKTLTAKGETKMRSNEESIDGSTSDGLTPDSLSSHDRATGQTGPIRSDEQAAPEQERLPTQAEERGESVEELRDWSHAEGKPPPTQATSPAAYKSASTPTRSTIVTGCCTPLCSTSPSRAYSRPAARKAASSFSMCAGVGSCGAIIACKARDFAMRASAG